MAEPRVFSKFLNPRVWKAVLAARMGGVKLEVRGAAANDELACRATLMELGKVPCLANDQITCAMANFDPLATNPAFAREFGPYLAKFTADQSVLTDAK